MKTLTINHVAILSALALHALLLTVQVRPQPLPTEAVTRIAIRLVAPPERQPPVAAPASAPVRAPIENNSQNHKQAGLTSQPVPPALPAEAPAVRQAETPAAPALTPSAPSAVEPFALETMAPAVPSERIVPAMAAATADRLPDYLAAVRAQVENHKDYPAFARQLQQQGTVTVRVTIGADGRLQKAVVGNSSGHASLDKAALAAVRNSGKFRAPDDFGLGMVTIDIPMTYKLI